ncbi:hypothetical protein [Vibrio anguillarum]|uniref:hypothetical protein n=1 Tax=Vibrio anguillarum TaxID=55601 RepID=UPI0018FE96EC|nr:hypothetical protein [Vibrio anguillarum]MBF4424734.1 hypothetical protein [Vibrio anguillarum]
MKKRKLILIMIVVMVIFLSFILYPSFKTFFVNNDEIWGNEPDEPYITITGKKPTDAQVVAWAAYWVTGDECKTYSYDMFGRKAHQGGKIDKKYTYDFSDDPSRYELRLPYKSVVDSNQCTVALRDVSIHVYNNFDENGFAELRIYSPTNSYDKVIDINSIVQAKECNAKIWQWASKDRWSGAMTCFYFVNDIIKTKEPESNAYTVYYDFSKFNNDTVIHYDILAGENYRSEPLVQEQAAVAQ